MINPVRLLTSNELDKNTLIVFISNAVVALVFFLGLPVLTRLYTPSDFGQLQIILTSVAILSVVSTLQYELAIVLANDTRDSNRIVLLCFTLLVLAVIFIGCLLAGFEELLLATIYTDLNADLLWLIPVLLLATVLFNIGQQSLVAVKNFRKFSINNAINSITFNAAGILLGLVAARAEMLVYSYVLAFVICVIVTFKTGIAELINSYNPERIKRLCSEFKRFPQITTLSVLINTLGMHLPVILFGYYFSIEFLGLYIITVKLLDIPLNLLRNSFSQVYFQAAAEKFARDSNEYLQTHLGVLIRLICIAAVFTLVVFLISGLVPLYFGSMYEQSSTLIKILIFWKVLEFLHASVGHGWSVIAEDKMALKLRTVSLFIRFIPICYYQDDYIKAVLAFSIVSGLYYLMMNLLLLRLIRNR